MKHGSVMGTLMELQDSYVRYLLADNWRAQSKNDPLILWPFLKVFRSS